MPTAMLLSLHTYSRATSPRFWATATMPRPSAAPSTTPASPASPELKAMVFWATDQRFNVRRPRTHTPPLVGRRAARRPATSVPARTLTAFPASCHGGWRTALGRRRRSRASWRSAAQPWR
eukprot:15037647-Alexandrium_andersonii.AAC.1